MGNKDPDQQLQYCLFHTNVSVGSQVRNHICWIGTMCINHNISRVHHGRRSWNSLSPTPNNFLMSWKLSNKLHTTSRKTQMPKRRITIYTLPVRPHSSSSRARKWIRIHPIQWPSPKHIVYSHNRSKNSHLELIHRPSTLSGLGRSSYWRICKRCLKQVRLNMMF